MDEQESLYQRYMVFTWSEYDNVEPFDCVEGSFDTAEDAIAYTSENGNVADDGTRLYCVFDRISGVFLET